MKRFSAQYVFTNSGPPLKRGIVTTDDDGEILSVEDTGGELGETSATEFHNGIIVPGFVNCHCHLELSHLKGRIKSGNGLPDFIMKVRSVRETGSEEISYAIAAADREMYDEGIVLCADICNNSSTFTVKTQSRIKYLNLIEVFGIDPAKAGKRMGEANDLAKESAKYGLKYSIVPHSPYSVSLPLFSLIRRYNPEPEVSSIHFMETEGESLFLSEQEGPLRESYEAGGIMPQHPELAKDHRTIIEKELAPAGSLILVHNTFIDREIIHILKKRGNTWLCLCPGSNLYIENRVPPVALLRDEGCEIVTGTDSLSSNTRLSILNELRILQERFPGTSLQELVRWSTLNGAEALNERKFYGSIEPGKKPGLLLLENTDLQNSRLLPGTTVKRLI